jgi:hypothetical protein
MEIPKRLESTSWWRLGPVVLWSGFAGLMALPVSKVPPGVPSSFLQAKSLHILTGIAIGVLAYLVQRALRMNQRLPGITLSALRIIIVYLVLYLLWRHNPAEAFGASLVGFLWGLLFYAIERGVAKLAPPSLGGNKPEEPASLGQR